MNSYTETSVPTSVAARVAGEDLQPGDFVTVLNEVVEFASFFWSDLATSLSPSEPVRTRYMPREAGKPHKVISVCLPFVYAKSTKGKIVVFDMRQSELVRLDANRGRAMWKTMKKSRRKKKKQSSSDSNSG